MLQTARCWQQGSTAGHSPPRRIQSNPQWHTTKSFVNIGLFVGRGVFDSPEVEEFFEAFCFAGVYFLQGELLESGEVVVGSGYEWACGWIIAWRRRRKGRWV